MATEALLASLQMKSMPGLQACGAPRLAWVPARSRHGSFIAPAIRSTINRECFFDPSEEKPGEVQGSRARLRAFRIAVSKSSAEVSPSRAGRINSVQKKASPTFDHEQLMKEQHKYFDHVFITVRSGDGGHGTILRMPNNLKDVNEKKRKQTLYKRDSDGSLILPTGGHGGDVVIFADESMDSLLQFHEKTRYLAKQGGHVNAMGILTSQLHDGAAAPTLRIPVPTGTVVKSKKGKFLADLVYPGDEILVARGGQGGISLLHMKEPRRKQSTTLTTNVMRNETDKVLVLGQLGEEVRLELILRVVADVGLVGLPNAGKSTLLAALTRAKPNIADYPFTTLMPNIGHIGCEPSSEVSAHLSEATLADLPGLIEGAHLGKGLGRNFLRHLRRTRLLVHVVDAAADDPINDYRIVKEELRMYNPTYLERPYIVVLNKIDLPMAHNRLPTLVETISKIGCSHEPIVHVSEAPIPKPENNYLDLPAEVSVGIFNERKEKTIEDYSRPLAVVGASLLHRIGADHIITEIRAALNKGVDER